MNEYDEDDDETYQTVTIVVNPVRLNMADIGICLLEPIRGFFTGCVEGLQGLEIALQSHSLWRSKRQERDAIVKDTADDLSRL